MDTPLGWRVEMPAPHEPTLVDDALGGAGAARAGSNGSNGSGRGPDPLDDAPVLGPRPPGPSVRMALVALGLALLVFTAGIVADLLSGTTPSSPQQPALAHVAGSSLQAIQAGPELAPVVSNGEPPGNILDSLVLPAGTTRVGYADVGVDGYDTIVRFSTKGSQQAVITFFEQALLQEGWSLLSKGPPRRGPGFQVLAKKAGADGFYWEGGVTVLPSSFIGSETVTPFSLELFQITDTQ